MLCLKAATRNHPTLSAHYASWELIFRISQTTETAVAPPRRACLAAVNAVKFRGENGRMRRTRWALPGILLCGAGMIRTITIEREYGCGAAQIAEKLASRLGWKLWDQQLTQEI